MNRWRHTDNSHTDSRKRSRHSSRTGRSRSRNVARSRDHEIHGRGIHHHEIHLRGNHRHHGIRQLCRRHGNRLLRSPHHQSRHHGNRHHRRPCRRRENRHRRRQSHRRPCRPRGRLHHRHLHRPHRRHEPTPSLAKPGQW